MFGKQFTAITCVERGNGRIYWAFLKGAIRANAIKRRIERHRSGEHTRLGCGFRRPAEKSGRRDANPNTRDACAPQQKRLVRWRLCIFKRMDLNAFALRVRWGAFRYGGKSNTLADPGEPATKAGQTHPTAI